MGCEIKNKKEEATMKRVITVLVLVMGIANAEVESKDSLVLPSEEMHLPQATQEFNNAKAKLIKAKNNKEQQEIEMQKNKLEKELKQINKEFERAKYNKIESELKNLQEKSKNVSFYDTKRVYEKFEETLDKLTREL